MIPEKLLQECIDEYKAVCQKRAALFSRNGQLLTASGQGEDRLWAEGCLSCEELECFFLAESTEMEREQACLFQIQFESGDRWAFVTEGNMKEVRKAALMAAGQLKRLESIVGKKKSRKQVLKDLLEGKLTGDEEECRTFVRLGRQKEGKEEWWLLFLIESDKGLEENIERVLAGLFAGEKKAESVKAGKNQVAFACPVSEREEGKEERTAAMISDTISGELMIKVHVAVSSRVCGISGLSRAYGEARAAMEIGKIFFGERNVFSFDCLGIGRLIYGLPVSVCQSFIKDVFHRDTVPEIDKELQDTAYRFLANNLNLSETGRQLYLHRNTLVYRLEKLHKETGLDIRNFDEAMIFRIGMMIGEYLKHKKE